MKIEIIPLLEWWKVIQYEHTGPQYLWLQGLTEYLRNQKDFMAAWGNWAEMEGHRKDQSFVLFEQNSPHYLMDSAGQRYLFAIEPYTIARVIIPAVGGYYAPASPLTWLEEIPRFMAEDHDCLASYEMNYERPLLPEPLLLVSGDRDGTYEVRDHNGVSWRIRMKIEPRPAKSDYRTQKARGLEVLRTVGGVHVPGFNVHPIEGISGQELTGYFVRPCPTVPRHGFVDSRLIENAQQGEEIIQATREADPQAEIITMYPVPAKHSAVWTPGLLAIGASNDGATQGRNALALPCIGDEFPIAPLHGHELAMASVKDTPYIEMLWTSSASWPLLVQLRDGPALPSAVNFIPKDMTVRTVIKAEGDLLAWEYLCHHAKPGTACWHPGGTLASHYAVHCILNGIPVVTDQQIKKGSKLTAQTQETPLNLYALRAGFMAAVLDDKVTYHQAGYAMLAACHNLSKWIGRHDYLLGLGLGFGYRLTVIAALGEYRHRGRSHGSKASRDKVYSQGWGKTLSADTVKRFIVAVNGFFDPTATWPSDGYGGPKWGEFSTLAIDTFNAVRRGKGKEALECLNRTVNVVHNGGWAFNKFLPEEECSKAAHNPTRPLLLSAPLIYRLWQDYPGHHEAWVKELMAMKPMKTISRDGEESAEVASRSKKLDKLPATPPGHTIMSPHALTVADPHSQIYKVMKVNNGQWKLCYYSGSSNSPLVDFEKAKHVARINNQTTPENHYTVMKVDSAIQDFIQVTEPGLVSPHHAQLPIYKLVVKNFTDKYGPWKETSWMDAEWEKKNEAVMKKKPGEPKPPEPTMGLLGTLAQAQAGMELAAKKGNQKSQYAILAKSKEFMSPHEPNWDCNLQEQAKYLTFEDMVNGTAPQHGVYATIGGVAPKISAVNFKMLTPEEIFKQKQEIDELVKELTPEVTPLIFKQELTGTEKK